MLPRPANRPSELQRSIGRIATLAPFETSPVNVFSFSRAAAICSNPVRLSGWPNV
jgi:hypothetical protein